MSLSLSIGILGQVWYLIVSIPDLAPLLSFKSVIFEGTYFIWLKTDAAIGLDILVM